MKAHNLLPGSRIASATLFSALFGLSGLARSESEPATLAEAMTHGIATGVRLVAQGDAVVVPVQSAVPAAGGETVAASRLVVTGDNGALPASYALNLKNFYRNSDPDHWLLNLTMPGWFTAMDGSSKLKGVEQHVDVGFGDFYEIMSHYLSYAVLINAEARRGPWSLWTDVVFMKLSGHIEKEKGLPPLLQHDPGSSLSGNANFDSSTAIIELGGGYRFLDKQWNSGPSPKRISMDVIGGIRYWRLETGLDGDATLSIGPISKTKNLHIQETEEWIDPFIGLRAQIDLTDKMFLYARGDIGGFGVGSDLTWKAAAGISYNVTPRLSSSLGWQVLSVDYSEGDFAYDVRMGGPVIGLSYSFGGPDPAPGSIRRAEVE